MSGLLRNRRLDRGDSLLVPQVIARWHAYVYSTIPRQDVPLGDGVTRVGNLMEHRELLEVLSDVHRVHRVTSKSPSDDISSVLPQEPSITAD
jgi:hypothetical protein